jgi:hypothetical protein
MVSEGLAALVSVTASVMEISSGTLESQAI